MGADEPVGGPLTTPAVFTADGEVGRDLAEVEWSATPLGPPDSWPQSLRTTVSILLSSRFSMWMAWGPQLTFFCNAAYRRDTLGRKYPWALGRPASEVWAEIWPDIGPRIERVLSTGEATWDAGLLLFLERSGYPEETYHTFSYSPLRDDDGSVVGMLCVVSEDTERVIGERRMATLRDLGSDPSVVRTEDEMLAFTSRQLGLNLRDLPFCLTYLFDDGGGARLASFSGISPRHPAAPAVLPPDGTGPWPVAAAARGETVTVGLDDDPFGDLPTGEWHDPPTQAIVTPLVQQGGAPWGFLVAALNRYRPLDDGYRGFVTLVAGHLAAGIGSARSYRTQQRRAEELAELDRAKTLFFSNISHEFRTPLTLILGPVADLRARAAGLDANARHELDVIHRNGLRLAKLVNTLLDFSRIEAGRMQAHYEPVDLSSVTAELASVFRSAVERAGLRLTVSCPPLDEPVYLDRDMWEKVMFNLLSNALKFTFEGSISVAVGGGRDEAVVTVSDTGIGVPAEEMPRLFERFHRIETTRARSTEGSGIGLALVKELIGLHGGSIDARSVEGAGTTFTIRLPLGAGHLPTDALTPPGGAGAPSGVAEPFVQEALRWLPGHPDDTDGEAGPPGRSSEGAVAPAMARPNQAHVLVADDNADMREYLVRLLRGAGYRVEGVADGQQALDAIRTDVPDLVVSDVMMPQVDGLALVAALRGDPVTASLPVLLLSARAGQEASIEGLRAGADDYLVKPFAAAELLARVHANIELARLRNHHARWRTALVHSMHEGFFVCDEQGAVVEINNGFTDILGFGPQGLPYHPPFPWWTDAEADPEENRRLSAMFADAMDVDHGNYLVPVIHRDGHRLWVNFSTTHVDDPDTGRRVMVGTLRDVTAEHYRVQRQTTLAALNEELSQADTVDEALLAATRQFHRFWNARRVLAATFVTRGGPEGPDSELSDLVSSEGSALWSDLSPRTRRIIRSLADESALLTVDTSESGTAAIALQHPRGVLVLWIELAEHRRFSLEDQSLLAVLAGRLGQGLQRAHQVDQQRETALALQHAILGPEHLPPGFAVRYQPATRPLQVGGDWYDVVTLDDGRIALIVGDCVGHGLTAAAIMGQLRSACRALLLERLSPAATLAGLDRFAARLPGARCTTALCAVLDPETGALSYSSAGHPPPILVDADGACELLEGGHSIPLGLQPERPRPQAEVEMSSGATLLLYTDGLVERRNDSLDRGIARASLVVQQGRGLELGRLGDEVMTRLTPEAGYQDDVALLLYHHPAPLHMTFPSHVGQLAPARAALRGWLRRVGVDAEQAQNVLIAAGEAVANAIEHGHRDHPDGPISLTATTSADEIRVTVSDSGSWKPPQSEANTHRGRGIALMRAFMTDVDIHPDSDGTTVEMTARIVR